MQPDTPITAWAGINASETSGNGATARTRACRHAACATSPNLRIITDPKTARRDCKQWRELRYWPDGRIDGDAQAAIERLIALNPPR